MAYLQMNNQLTHGGVTLSKESIKNYINKKPAYPSIYGNVNRGFIYNVDWYGENDFYTIDCANKVYNSAIEKDVLNLADTIDKTVQE